MVTVIKDKFGYNLHSPWLQSFTLLYFLFIHAHNVLQNRWIFIGSKFYFQFKTTLYCQIFIPHCGKYL